MSDEIKDPQPLVDRIVDALDDACKRGDWAYVRAVIASAESFRRHLSDAEARRDGELAALRARIDKGRAKFANGCTILSLVDEVGEAVRAVNKREGVERCRDELLDVAAVAMRLYLGEIDRENVVVGLEYRRVEGQGAHRAGLPGDEDTGGER